MTLGFRSKAKTLFLDVDTPQYKENTPLNIILSPSLYWVKKVELPVKYLRDVKPLLPSLFEEHLPSDKKYSYSAYKEGESFLIFAYNDKEILDLIAEKGISSSNLKNIYLAQSELNTLEAPAKVSDEGLLMVNDSVVMRLPLALAPEALPLNLENHTPSKHTIHLTRFNQIADKKSQLLISSIFGILILMFAIEWMITSSKVTHILQRQEAVFNEHHLQATSFQNEAIYSKLNNVFERQARIRDILNLALTIKLQPKEQLERISLEKRKIVIVIKTPTEEQGETSLSKLKKHFKRTQSRFSNGTYVMEIQL